jgi:hypothetical protein
MSTTTTIGPAVRAAFDDLIDYAGLFPPAQLAMEPAVAEYAGARGGATAWMLGRFIVPASRIPELLESSRMQSAAGASLPVSVIVDATLDPRRWFDSMREMLSDVARLRDGAERAIAVRALEIRLAPLPTARETFDASIGQLGALLERAGLRDLPAYVELPPEERRSDLRAGAMTALARARLSAKLRCGGIVAEAFPAVDEVARFIAAAADAGVTFKATAGLHHPVRHLDAASGFTMHGFLNLLAAATFAPRVDANVLSRIVGDEDPEAFAFDDASFAWRDHRATIDELRTARASAFAGYGSCSFDEPVEDLTALGLLPVAG